VSWRHLDGRGYLFADKSKQKGSEKDKKVVGGLSKVSAMTIPLRKTFLPFFILLFWLSLKPNESGNL
jgi:hypothetical protein